MNKLIRIEIHLDEFNDLIELYKPHINKAMYDKIESVLIGNITDRFEFIRNRSSVLTDDRFLFLYLAYKNKDKYRMNIYLKDVGST